MFYLYSIQKNIMVSVLFSGASILTIVTHHAVLTVMTILLEHSQNEEFQWMSAWGTLSTILI